MSVCVVWREATREEDARTLRAGWAHDGECDAHVAGARSLTTVAHVARERQAALALWHCVRARARHVDQRQPLLVLLLRTPHISWDCTHTQTHTLSLSLLRQLLLSLHSLLFFAIRIL